MRHRVTSDGASRSAQYEWRLPSGWARLYSEATGEPVHPADGSIEQFITEHYWGYSTQHNAGSVEYHVTHPQWRVWQSLRAGFDGDAAEIYGRAFGETLRRPPDSAFIADGSPVVVFAARRVN
jgi:hypothetical protein